MATQVRPWLVQPSAGRGTLSACKRLRHRPAKPIRDSELVSQLKSECTSAISILAQITTESLATGGVHVRLLLKSGTIVDATIIDAPPSTKNEAQARDPEMKQGKKNSREWRFGKKAHIGTDTHGLVHSLATTHAGAADITQLPKLLHDDERVVYGDQAYWSADHRQAAEERGIRYRMNRRPNGRHPLTPYQRAINRSRSRTRARAEHAFHVVKCLWGFTKVRYRGLTKNTARLFTAFALANLYMVRRRLMQPGERCLC